MKSDNKTKCYKCGRKVESVTSIDINKKSRWLCSKCKEKTKK